MKPIIGIIERKEKLPSKNKISYINEEINEAITNSNGIPIGIDIKNIYEIINNIDGFIFQGGNEYQEEEKDLIKYLYNNNIPTLGICLGMQEMVEAFNGELYKINNHKNTKHKINIGQNTKLYDIIKSNKIAVNSRHEFAVKSTNFNISAKADNIIEAIEDKKKDFFIGVEWHPESLNNEDSKNLFNYFIKKAGEYNGFKRNIKSNTRYNT